MENENQVNIIGKQVLDLQIKAIKKLKNSIDNTFFKVVKKIINCKSKVIICGVGKSGKIASKISSTLSSVGTSSFTINVNDCSHGDLGMISKNDLLILISYSGSTEELTNIIKYAKINKIYLIGIVSNKDSFLYKKANIALLLPKVEEAGYGIVPTSSTTMQLSLGDALSIASMKKKNFTKLDFKKFHPGGNLGNKLKTAADVMLVKKKIPFIDENVSMKYAINILNKINLGFLVVINSQGNNTGVFTDGDLKRFMQKKKVLKNEKLKTYMTKNPYIVEKNMLASDILSQMNKRKITNVCVYNNKNKKKIIGVIHIHHLLKLVK
jgi:arabinose-5-phosphate isomerase